MTVASVDYVEAFRQACAALQVKPVLLDPQTRNQGVIKDAMTSSVFFGCNAEALAQLEAAPRLHANPAMPNDCYFECHFGVKTSDAPHRPGVPSFGLPGSCLTAVPPGVQPSQ